MEQCFFSTPYFETWIKHAHPQIKNWFEREIDYLKTSIPPNSRILDVGCGFGRHIALLAPMAKEIIGIDNSSYMIDKAKSQLSHHSNVQLLKQDIEKLSFAADHFDYVICMTNTFGDFIEKKERAISEMARVCKPNGTVVISVYSNNALKVRLEDYKKVGLTIREVKGKRIYTDQGLVSEQFCEQELTDLFVKHSLTSKISNPNEISILCEGRKSSSA